MERKTVKFKFRTGSVIFFLLAAVFFTGAFIYQDKVSDFSDMITLEEGENGFSQSQIEEIRKDEENTVTFTAWSEMKDQPITAEINSRSETADVLLLSGPSDALLPWGKNLFADDVEGCIIGAELAQLLFGGTKVQGQTVLLGERTLVIRGVVEEPGKVLLCQVLPEEENLNAGMSAVGESKNNHLSAGNVNGQYLSIGSAVIQHLSAGNAAGQYLTTDSAVAQHLETEDAVAQCFDRINILDTDPTKTASQTAAEFISRYSLDAQILHYEYKRDLSWLTDLIPGKWSDFSGWSENWHTFGREIERMEKSEKSDIEQLSFAWTKKRNLLMLSGVAALLFCPVLQCVKPCLRQGKTEDDAEDDRTGNFDRFHSVT